MFIVYMYNIATRDKNLCVVCETREKAEEYIRSQLEGYTYNGTGFYEIDEIKLYN